MRGGATGRNAKLSWCKAMNDLRNYGHDTCQPVVQAALRHFLQSVRVAFEAADTSDVNILYRIWAVCLQSRGAPDDDVCC